MKFFQKENEVKLNKAEYDENAFSIVQKADILTLKDFETLQSLIPELKETFVKSQVFRTRTEMEVSVLNAVKFPTSASKYWQSVREQNVMFQELVILSYEYRKNLVEIKILKRDMEKMTDNLKKELKQIEIEKKTFILRHQEKTAKDRIRELKMWSEIKEREAQNMSNEELSDVDNHQLVSYTRRWINQSIEMGMNGSIAERQNLLGQLRSGIITCIERGIIENVISVYANHIQKKIREEYGIPKQKSH